MIRQITAALILAAAMQPMTAQAQQRTEPQREDSAAPAFTVSELRELDEVEVPRLGITVDRLEDMDIVGPDGEEIGEVEEILVDRDGRIVAIAAEFGGFLGIGEREVVIGLDQLAVQSNREKLVVAMTREQLMALPEWDD